MYDKYVHHILETDGRDDSSVKALTIKKFYDKIYIEYLTDNENKRFSLFVSSVYYYIKISVY